MYDYARSASRTLFEALIIADAYKIPVLLDLATIASEHCEEPFVAFALACAGGEIDYIQATVGPTLLEDFGSMSKNVKRYLKFLHQDRFE